MIDGGISSNNFIVQFLATLVDKPVVSIGIPDVSALGAAYLAGLQQKIFKDLDHLSQLNRDKKILKPLGGDKMKSWYKGWQNAVTGK
jgi:glycerol kinase